MNGKFKDEVVKRLKLLGVDKQDIQYFELTSQPIIHGDGFITFDRLFQILQEIKELQLKYGGLAYYITYDKNYPFVNVLWLSSNEEEWEMDYEDIQNDLSFAYVLNLNDDMLSEFGTIGISNINNQIVRVE